MGEVCPKKYPEEQERGDGQKKATRKRSRKRGQVHQEERRMK